MRSSEILIDNETMSLLREIEDAAYAKTVYSDMESYPSSPPLGFPAPKATRAKVRTVNFLNGKGELDQSEILEHDSSNESKIAYLLPGGL
jgi:hypothetical protein